MKFNSYCILFLYLKISSQKYKIFLNKAFQMNYFYLRFGMLAIDRLISKYISQWFLNNM